MATLYKWPEFWGLPSLSVGCIQAEAYLRMSGAQFQVQPCSTPSRSPTGHLPAVEKDTAVSGGDQSDLAASRKVIQWMKSTVIDLDAHLKASQKAEILAFTNLIETRLDVATMYSILCEPKGFAEYRKAAFDGRVPFPLNYALPFGQYRDFKSNVKVDDAEKMYADACTVISAVSDLLRGSESHFLFGSSPSSLDALLFGHLLFYRSSPAAAPVLRDRVASQPALCVYIDHILTTFFAYEAPVATHSEQSSGKSSWSEAGQGQRSMPKSEPTTAELHYRRNSKLWLLGAGAAIAAYVVLSGKYVQFVLPTGGDDGHVDADDDDDDGGDD